MEACQTEQSGGSLERCYYVGKKDEDCLDVILKIISTRYGIAEQKVKKICQERLESFLKDFIDDIGIIIETDYVDKVYRDSYYAYYASKSVIYSRNCIKMSLFAPGDITLDNKNFKQIFCDPSRHPSLQSQYLGFIVIRPTFPAIIGRNAISPRAFKDNQWQIAQVAVPSTANGLKLYVDAFPHASQDAETMTCAETTLWTLMEYYGNKYPEYSPTLPSKLIHLMRSITAERQLPSTGLNPLSMSYTLKEIGFGPKIYSRANFRSDFDACLSCYIESGIPLLVVIDNTSGGSGAVLSRICHSTLCIGHRNTPVTQDNKPGPENIDGIDIYDVDKIQKDFVFIDDNYPPYRLAKLDTPAEYYSDSDWKRCQITHFIVPLYKKIYMDAIIAKSCFKHLFIRLFGDKCRNKHVVMRAFICSTRSYYDFIQHSELDSDMKEMIMSISMPKFVWIAELSDYDLINQNKNRGLIILDPTEACTDYDQQLVLAFYDDSLYLRSDMGDAPQERKITPMTFNGYQSNLK